MTSMKEKVCTKIRNDDDREINHHGRPVEVGEAESSPEGTVQVVFRKHSFFFRLILFSIHLTLIFQVADKDLVAVNEQVQLKALKNFYDRWFCSLTFHML